MSLRNLPLVARNASRLLSARAAKFYRRCHHRALRFEKHGREFAKDGAARVRRAVKTGRVGSHAAYSGAVHISRYWGHVQIETMLRIRRDVSARLELWRAAHGSHTIIVGPWLSEVGYEVLYWVPFLRWFEQHYHVDPSRVVAVSRGGVSAWYSDIAHKYVEILDLLSPAEYAMRNSEWQEGVQKQMSIAGMDERVIAAVRGRLGLADAALLHPSAMFRLLRQFWLGNESLEYALSYMRFARLSAPHPIDLPPLPDAFTAIKFYTGKALPDAEPVRRLLRSLVERAASRRPVVMLNTALAFDEHEDYCFPDIPGVISVAPSLTPQVNLAVQTEVIRRADLFVGTCGSLAWLAPMLGTQTLAVYADDHLLTSHLYAARHAYRLMDAARFTPLDLEAVGVLDLTEWSLTTAR